jgi:predicted lipoprotein with Yx(FWY)xxD motif
MVGRVTPNSEATCSGIVLIVLIGLLNFHVTYNGHPLYYWIGDTRSGDTAGQALNNSGGLWYALNPSGQEITTH